MKIPEVIRIENAHRPGSLARLLDVIGQHGLTVEHLAAVERREDITVWEITLEFDETVDPRLFADINALPSAKVLGRSDRVFQRHEGGKIRTVSTASIDSIQQLRDIYTPGVARVCLAIRDDPSLARRYTNINNTVAIVTNGTAILGLGNIGPLAGLPVMEGKAALMHHFAGLSGVPILLDETDPDRIVEAIAAIAPSFGAIQLEDIAAPECFEIEERLVARLDRPVLHDDQHGTAVVTLAVLLSATRAHGQELTELVVGHVGLGAAGIGIARLMAAYGVRGVLGADLSDDALARLESMGGTRATLDEVMARADVVITTTGVRGLIRPEMIRQGQYILALSNPEPEIAPGVALDAGARFAADGRTVNNVLGYPGMFRGALDAGAPRFTDAMLLAAAHAIAACGDDRLVPDALDHTVHRRVAEAVAAAAVS